MILQTSHNKYSGWDMQQDDQYTQNTNPASDDVAKQLADLQSQPATSQLPGQQFTPVSMASVPDENTTEHPAEPVIETAPVDNQPQGFTPPADDTEPEQQLSEKPPADSGPYQANPAENEELSQEANQTEAEQSVEAPSPEPEAQNTEEASEEASADSAPAPAVDFDFSSLTGPSRSPTPTSDDSSTTTASDDDIASDSALEEVKKQTIEELAPLVDKLDLPPEKRYDILMEIIQANNDRGKLQDALRSASEIANLDLRARALMEILDEVKYFESSSEA